MGLGGVKNKDTSPKLKSKVKAPAKPPAKQDPGAKTEAIKSKFTTISPFF